MIVGLKEILKKAFEAGDDYCSSLEWGRYAPPFDQWYAEFEKEQNLIYQNKIERIQQILSERKNIYEQGYLSTDTESVEHNLYCGRCDAMGEAIIIINENK